MHNKTLLLILGAAMMASGALYAQEPAEDRATFRTVKGYDDSNPGPVEVTIICNTGLPLEQTFELDPLPSPLVLDPHVEFVVTDFESGTLDCEITESVPTGYTGFYARVIDGQVDVINEESCLFENVEHGSTFSDDPVNNLCIVANLLNPSEVTVTKEWIDENPEFNPNNFAEATYTCTNLPDLVDPPEPPALGNIFPPATEGGVIGDPESGNLTFIGNPGVDSFLTLGNWDGGTVCSVTEQLVDSGVETDSSDCDSIVLFPGDSGACTIVNTRLFEGIPTLSQYGLGLLALLMLGMGFVAFRRIV